MRVKATATATDKPWDMFPDHITMIIDEEDFLRLGMASEDGEYQATYVLNSVQRLRIKHELEDV
jgi:hypothetical protein